MIVNISSCFSFSFIDYYREYAYNVHRNEIINYYTKSPVRLRLTRLFSYIKYLQSKARDMMGDSYVFFLLLILKITIGFCIILYKIRTFIGCLPLFCPIWKIICYEWLNDAVIPHFPPFILGICGERFKPLKTF